ncbi:MULTISPECIES: thiamine phosphate synthase [unclassified Halanaerobium]|uniref:thiamine phosphate synthase n=1 Tax=unclassified Halanaerobium TaxID=2641197 RepID=UPI000DF2CE52|nr:MULTISPECIES: thiamine phosphate synthase [unclassified Halanaerobium]RCW50759.1 thiamine-phosphate diphosphorylase [Halanaerobium sp. MA284_MarDTE_T2]RCW78003.1 thiamine-phosphate diphosphorylase [Halanaerobium sp. DL-01]
MKKIDWDIYLLTEERLSNGRSTVEVVKEAIRGGIEVIQLREKALPLRERFQLGLKIKELTQKADVDLIINDRVDLALALDADGVHLGQDDLPLSKARKIMGKDKIIGISACREEEIRAAEADGADYIGVGAVFTTRSKKVEKEKDGIGCSAIKKISQNSNLPIIAIGGINKDNCQSVIAAGADTISVISALTQAENIALEVKEFKEKIKAVKRGAV